MLNTNKTITLLTLLDYQFNDIKLLETALTHRSYSVNNNERLEFLGDGILNFVIAHELFKRYPNNPEGDLSRLRANLVDKETLAEISIYLQLSDVIKLGSGELKSGGFKRPSILADAVESILGAVYCDGGFEHCQNLIIRLYQNKLNTPTDLNSLKDPKTQLQEIVQSRRIELPIYEVKKISGKAHDQIFHVRCVIKSLGIQVEGKGKSRRKAEQNSAQYAIELAQEKLRKIK